MLSINWAENLMILKLFLLLKQFKKCTKVPDKVLKLSAYWKTSLFYFVNALCHIVRFVFTSCLSLWMKFNKVLI